MLISVIIPVYNAAIYLRSCLDRITSEPTNPQDQLEIICIDDGSTDDSFTILKEYSKKGLLTPVKLDTNQGVSAARNKGLELCSGDVILFLDSDDYFEPGIFIYISENICLLSPDILVMKSSYVRNEADNYPNSFLPNTLYSTADLSKYDYARGSVCGVAFSRQALKGLSFPEGIRNSEDTIFFAECLLNDVTVQFSKQQCYWIVKRDRSISRTFPITRYYSSKLSVSYVSDLLKRNMDAVHRRICGRLYYQIIIQWLICSCMVQGIKLSEILNDIKDVPNIPIDSHHSQKKKIISYFFNLSHRLLFFWLLFKHRYLKIAIS